MLQYQLAPTWIGAAFSFTLHAVCSNLLSAQYTFWSMRYSEIVRLNLTNEHLFFKGKISVDKSCLRKIIMTLVATIFSINSKKSILINCEFPNSCSKNSVFLHIRCLYSNSSVWNSTDYTCYSCRPAEQDAVFLP